MAKPNTVQVTKVSIEFNNGTTIIAEADAIEDVDLNVTYDIEDVPFQQRKNPDMPERRHSGRGLMQLAFKLRIPFKKFNVRGKS